MLKLPKRLPYEAALFAALMLGSCDKKQDAAGFTMEQRDEIRDLAADATSTDRERLDAIEEKLGMENGG
jgi:hypothetical protein